MKVKVERSAFGGHGVDEHDGDGFGEAIGGVLQVTKGGSVVALYAPGTCNRAWLDTARVTS